MGRQRADNLLRDLSKEREGKKDLRNMSLKTDGETENLHRDLFKEREGKRGKEQE